MLGRIPRPRNVSELFDGLCVGAKYFDEGEFWNACVGVAHEPPFEGLFCVVELLLSRCMHGFSDRHCLSAPAPLQAHI